MLLSEVLKIKKTETVIAEKEQELKRLNQKIDYKGSQIFFLNQPDGALRRYESIFLKRE